jgi:hypothetical protein
MLTAGASELDITPPLGTGMRGYFEERTADTVHDPLNVRSFVLEDDGAAVAIAVCDIIGIDRKYLDQARERIAETTDLMPEQVMIACTHTHTGPVTGDDDYTQWLWRRISDGVRIAWQEREPAEIGWCRRRSCTRRLTSCARSIAAVFVTSPMSGTPPSTHPRCS